MCAAPGMKTTHLAALMKDQGTLYAVEQDPKRFKIMESMVADAGTTCVKAINKDVLECTAKDFPGVEYILVDPSCSGTGLFNHVLLSMKKLIWLFLSLIHYKYYLTTKCPIK